MSLTKVPSSMTSFEGTTFNGEVRSYDSADQGNFVGGASGTANRIQIRGASHPNTPNVITMDTNGSEKLRLDASGNLATIGAVTSAGASNSGNLTFTGTGNLIRGDFSNATAANRVMFQTSTANGASYLFNIPNGTGVVSGFYTANNSDVNNSSYAALRVNSTEASVLASYSGTGTYLPMVFYTGGSERMQIGTNGQQSSTIVGFSGTYPEYKCRAWVNFNGTGTVAIRASGNVSSITDNGVGKFGINFTNAMPDANYSIVGTQNYSDDNADTALNIVAQIRRITTPLTTTVANVMTSYNQILHDPTIACFSVFR